jgi:hypothetical protein
MRRLLVVAATVFVLVLAAATAALAGEVKGPPGTPCGPGTDVPICSNPSFNDTAAPSHANSACAFSGLNDLNPAFGQTASIVQTAADSFKFYHLAPGVEGTAGLCQGGTN